MKATEIFLAFLWSIPLLAQAPAVITMDDEPHHHLVFKNDIVKMFSLDLEPRDSFLMHRHDYDDVSIVIADATTVSTTPGRADVLTISKTGNVRFALSGRAHSVRNIGQTAYRAVSIDLLRPQTGARNLCGKQIPDRPQNCLAASPADASASHLDQPQFETDQTRVTLTRVGPQQSATFGEPDRDDLIVTIDESAAAAAPGKGSDKALHPGDFVWVGRGEAQRVFKNNSQKEARVVTVALKP
jgi:quercetin dioxygenase-like cupin family protein